MLSAEGWEVTLASNGREAVDKVAASRPGDFELVLMDLQMPVLDGCGAAGEIRALPDPALAAVPIVALTADADEDAVRAVRAAGMNGHAAKPLDVAALKKLIDGILPPQEN